MELKEGTRLDVPIGVVKNSRLNSKIYPNKDQEQLDQLMDSISVYGQLEPIVINLKGVILSGHRRFEAIKSLKEKTIDAIVVNKVDNEGVLVHHNIQRTRNLKELQNEDRIISETIKKTIKKGRRPKGAPKQRREIEISAEIQGRTLNELKQTRAIQKADPSLFDQVSEGKITRNQATKIIRERQKKDLPQGKEDTIKEGEILNTSIHISQKQQKLDTIKMVDRGLYDKVMTKTIPLQNAYNQVLSDINMVRESKGKGSQTTKTSVLQEVELIHARYKPKIEEFLDALRKIYPYTIDSYLKKK